MRPRPLLFGCAVLAGGVAAAAPDTSIRAEAVVVRPASPDAARDGQHDFDFEIGRWKVHVRRRLQPLTGSERWTELDGEVVVRKVWDGRANVAEVAIDGESGHIEILGLRLYDPVARQWSINFSNPGKGAFGVPLVGRFNDGRGEFYDQETYGGRSILVRFVYEPEHDGVARSEQSFSADGGKTWEVNWINDYTRVSRNPHDSD